MFTKRLRELVKDDDYKSVQLALVLRPEAGQIIRGSGGLRKIRWAASGGGKSGGYRFIYYWDKSNERIYMIFVYTKRAQNDLTPSQLKILRKLAKENLE